jgi:hypothetical protein
VALNPLPHEVQNCLVNILLYFLGLAYLYDGGGCYMGLFLDPLLSLILLIVLVGIPVKDTGIFSGIC